MKQHRRIGGGRFAFAGICLVAVLSCAGLTGCATTLEKSNRLFYHVNDGFDRFLLKPLSKVYLAITPRFFRQRVGNFFLNLGYLDTVANDFLQGKGGQGGDDALRFLTNTTIGLGGLFDPATGWGLPPHQEDFGQTLGVWGAGPGAYVVLPLLGPNSVRDLARIPFSALTSPLTWLNQDALNNGLGILGAIDGRARATDDFDNMRRAAADPYVFVREGYLQHRRFLVHDGEVPASETADDFGGLLEDLQGHRSGKYVPPESVEPAEDPPPDTDRDHEPGPGGE